jgi:hypothetical protein
MDPACLYPDATIIELTLAGENSWSVRLEAMNFDSVGFRANFVAVLDTGSTHLVLPRTLFFELITFLTNEHTGCREVNKEILCPEDHDLPVLGFQF